MARVTKKDVYAEYDITYDTKTEKILSPIGWIKPLLKEGNDKTGKHAYTFSTPAGTKGTCICDCPNCYAKTGFYTTPDVKASMQRNQYLVENHLLFVKNAILAQIKADKLTMVRIHASGDFNTANKIEYIQMWIDIINACQNVRFWTYTKLEEAENIFDCFTNANIVPSILPHSIGLNYGTCEQVINRYHAMIKAGYKPHICACGTNLEKHCDQCTGCSLNKFVLFLLHSCKDYDCKKDPLLPIIVKILQEQEQKEGFTA